MADRFTDITGEAVGLVRGERRGRGMAQRGDWLCVELFDAQDVVWANCGDGLGSAGAGDCSAEVVVVGSQLGAAAWVNIGQGGNLF